MDRAKQPPELDLAKLHEIMGRFPRIAVAYLFGSLARGDARADSDVDLGLVLQERGSTLDHRALGELASRLEEVTASRPLDLVVLDREGPMLRHRVLSEGRLVFERDRARRVDFESDTYSRYFDFLPTYEIATRGKIAATREWIASRR